MVTVAKQNYLPTRVVRCLRMDFHYIWLIALELILMPCLPIECLKIHKVELMGAPYLKVGSSDILSCSFDLSNSETVQTVVWTKDEKTVFTWSPVLGSEVLGSLVGFAEEGDPGWNIHIMNAVTSLEGNYTCTVITDKHTAAYEFQLLVFLLCKARIETEDSTGINCTVAWSIHCSRVYPDLNFTAGIYLPEENRFFDKPTTWTKIVYSDHTVGYSLSKSYNITEIPKSSIFLWNISYKDKFLLLTGNFSFGAVHRSGCPPPSSLPNMHLNLLGAQTTCRGELIPQANTLLRALYSCENDILHGNIPTHKALVCLGDTWHEETHEPWPQCSE